MMYLQPLSVISIRPPKKGGGEKGLLLEKETDIRTAIIDQLITYPIQDPIKRPTLTGFSDVFKAIDASFERGEFNFVGDPRDFKLCYLTQASVLHAHTENNLARPLGSFIVGDTSTGKTELLYSVSEIFPSQMKINLTSMSSKALMYACQYDKTYLNGKIILVEEMKGLDDPELQYLLRILVTKGWATHITVKGGESEVIEIVGRISLQSTGLPNDKLRDDTMNRMVKLSTDSSYEQTKKVVDHIKGRYSRRLKKTDSETGSEFYHNFFRGLKPYPVNIPFADEIEFDGKTPEQRRKAKIFLDLLSTVTLLNQHKRNFEDGYLIAEREDFEILFGLISRNEKETNNHNLKRTDSVILDVIQKNFEKTEFAYSDITGKKPGFTEGIQDAYGMTTIKNSILRLVDLGLLERRISARVAYFRYTQEFKSQNDWGVKDSFLASSQA